jgi:hypothetical protein
MINKYLLPLFVTSLTVLFLHLKGIDNEFYWSYWWYDIPMHLLGGIVVALVYAWLQMSFPKIPQVSWKSILVAIIFVGVAWEVWELFVGDTVLSDDGYFLDTIKDLFDDIIGAFITYFIINKFSRA